MGELMKMPETVNLKAVLGPGSSINTLRVDLSIGMRAPIVNGHPTLMGIWRADLYEVESHARRGKRPRFLGTFVTGDSEKESPADLLRQLADIYEAGELKVNP